jgi:hypothetical protein
MSSTPAATLADYWSDDFRPLQDAGKLVLAALRQDESDADLYDKITASEQPSHLYITPTPVGSNELGLKHLQSIPIPPLLAQERETVQSHSLMGLLTPASLAWMTVDSKLFLWPFEKGGEIIRFQVPSGQSIITVGLVRPKKGSFLIMCGSYLMCFQKLLGPC